jgi:hypothetical protein
LPHKILAPLDGLALEVAPQIPPVLRGVAHALALPQVGDDVHGLVQLGILHVDGQQTLHLSSDGLGGRARRLLAALDGPDERVRRRDLGEGGGVHFFFYALQLGVAALRLGNGSRPRTVVGQQIVTDDFTQCGQQRCRAPWCYFLGGGAAPG